MSAKKSPRIPRSTARRIIDLRHHLENLQDAHTRLRAGKVAAYKDVLTNLRTLLGKPNCDRNRGLLLEIMEQHGIEISGRDETGKKISFQESLLHEDVLNARRITRHQFVWELASQDAAHSDEGISPEFAMAESVQVSGTSTSILIISQVAELTLSAGAIVSRKFRVVGVDN